MKSHINKTQYRTEIVDEVQKNLEKSRLIGMQIGAKSVSKVILDIANDESITIDERIKKISKFCKKGIELNKIKM